MPAQHTLINPKHLGVGGQVIALGAAAVPSTVLAVGRWRLSGSGNCWFKQGGSTVTAAKAGAGSTYLGAGQAAEFVVEKPADDGYISVIQDGSATGNMSLTKLG